MSYSAANHRALPYYNTEIQTNKIHCLSEKLLIVHHSSPMFRPLLGHAWLIDMRSIVSVSTSVCNYSKLVVNVLTNVETCSRLVKTRGFSINEVCFFFVLISVNHSATYNKSVISTLIAVRSSIFKITNFRKT